MTALTTAELWLARCELGRKVMVYPLNGEAVRLPDHNKPRATILQREPTAWMFDSLRSALVDPLCRPGAAATGRSPAEAIAAAMALMSQYERARKR